MKERPMKPSMSLVIIALLSANAAADSFYAKYLGRGIINRESKNSVKATCVGLPNPQSNEPSCNQIQFVQFLNEARTKQNLGKVMSHAEFNKIVIEAKNHECFSSEELEEHEAAAFKSHSPKGWQHKPEWVSADEYENLLHLVNKYSTQTL